MNKKTTLFLGPEENISILKTLFSSRKTSPGKLAEAAGKSKGTIYNALHDLKLLNLINEDMQIEEEAKNIVYNRDKKKTLKELFLSIEGNAEAIKEVKKEDRRDPSKIGEVFCFHTNARATEPSSKKQIGRIYLRWLNKLGLINSGKDEGEKENGPGS